MHADCCSSPDFVNYATAGGIVSSAIGITAPEPVYFPIPCLSDNVCVSWRQDRDNDSRDFQFIATYQ